MSDLDRLTRAFQRLLRALLRRASDAALYPATVVAQNGDGSLELTSDAPGRPNLSKVPIQVGVPGITAVVKNGGQVLVGFLGGDRALPYVLVYDQAVVESLSLLGGTRPLARMGDALAVNLPPTTLYSGSFGTEALAGVPVAMATPFYGTIETGQTGALA